MDQIGILLSITGGLISILIMIIGWSANQIHIRLGEINETLSNIDRDLRHELSRLDTRLSVVETKLTINK